ncbi:MAG TPA: hypothetical protein VIX19_20345 [Terriglobales bacterium]
MSEQEPEKPRFVLNPAVRSHLTLIALAIAAIAMLVYGLHERTIAAHAAAQTVEASSETRDLRAQVGALTARLDSLSNANVPEASAQVAGRVTPPARHAAPTLHPTGSHQKPDPRWKKVQAQLDAEGKAIESTQQQLASTRSDLEGSIARTHDELVVLEKKGERNYFEFDLDKSKHFQNIGGMGISLRKANTKHEYADLELLVDDRQLSKKHLNLYEPAVFYPAGDRQPMELIVIGIAKNHVHGYISAPKYKASELASAWASDTKETHETDADKSRHKLEVPR